jgi:hypothetical protein
MPQMTQRHLALERLIYPKLGPMPINDIRRSDSVRLLDQIEDENGPSAAQMALAYTAASCRGTPQGSMTSNRPSCAAWAA